jgi:Na+/serine symporter
VTCFSFSVRRSFVNINAAISLAALAQEAVPSFSFSIRCSFVNINAAISLAALAQEAVPSFSFRVHLNVVMLESLVARACASHGRKAEEEGKGERDLHGDCLQLQWQCEREGDEIKR